MENYTNNQTTDLSLSLKVSSSVVVVKVAVMVVLDVVASLGNILVCCSVYKNPRLRTKTGFLILALSMSDLLFAMVVVPLSTASIARTNRYRNRPLWISKDNAGLGCFVQGTLFYSLTAMSLMAMAFAAVNRYLCVVHSNFYRKHFTLKTIRLSLVVMFLTVPLFMTCIAAPGFGRFEFVAEFGVCMLLIYKRYETFDRYVEKIAIVVWVLIPFVIIITCYSLIYCNVRRHSRSIGIRLATLTKPATTKNIEEHVELANPREAQTQEQEEKRDCATNMNLKEEKHIAIVQDVKSNGDHVHLGISSTEAGTSGNRLSDSSSTSSRPDLHHFKEAKQSRTEVIDNVKKSNEDHSHVGTSSTTGTSGNGLSELSTSTRQENHLKVVNHCVPDVIDIVRDKKSNEDFADVANQNTSLTTGISRNGLPDSSSTRPEKHLKVIKQSATEAKVTKILLMVFFGFCASFIPLLISFGIHGFTSIRTHISKDVSMMVIYCTALSTAINPFIYGLATRDFRKTYIALLTCKT